MSMATRPDGHMSGAVALQTLSLIMLAFMAQEATAQIASLVMEIRWPHIRTDRSLFGLTTSLLLWVAIDAAVLSFLAMITADWSVR